MWNESQLSLQLVNSMPLTKESCWGIIAGSWTTFTRPEAEKWEFLLYFHTSYYSHSWLKLWVSRLENLCEEETSDQKRFVRNEKCVHTKEPSLATLIKYEERLWVLFERESNNHRLRFPSTSFHIRRKYLDGESLWEDWGVKWFHGWKNNKYGMSLPSKITKVRIEFQT